MINYEKLHSYINIHRILPPYNDTKELKSLRQWYNYQNTLYDKKRWKIKNMSIYGSNLKMT